MRTLKTEGYLFEKPDSVQVTYPDGHQIDLGIINPIQIGISHSEGKWIVNIITAQSVQKLANNITEKLEMIGFRFDRIDNAITVHHFLVKELLES